MQTPLKSRDVCRILKLRYHTLFNLIRQEKMTAPARDSANDYLWWPADIRRAEVALAKKKKQTNRPLPQTEDQ